MKNMLTIIFFLIQILVTNAQNTNSEIKEIQKYIQSTSQNEWFDPVNSSGTLDNGTSYDLSYYVLPDTDIFSIIYTVYDKYTIQKVFYYKDKKLIACILEETDANNANKLIRYVDYFYKDGVLINTADENKNLPSNTLLAEGLELQAKALKN